MKICVISLKRSPERRENIKKQLDALGLEFEFFDAVDGRAEPPHPLFAKYDYFKRLWLTNGRMPSKGEMGCYASHYLLWQKCIDIDEPILVLEDDVVVRPHLNQFFESISKVAQEYGFVRLQEKGERSQTYIKEKNDEYSVSFLDNNFGGLLCYAISQSAAQKLVDGCTRWTLPVDNYVGSLYLHDAPSYLFSPSMVESIQDFDTTIQLGEESSPPIYRKLTRELYVIYRKVMMSIYNNRYKK